MDRRPGYTGLMSAEGSYDATDTFDDINNLFDEPAFWLNNDDESSRRSPSFHEAGPGPIAGPSSSPIQAIPVELEPSNAVGPSSEDIPRAGPSRSGAADPLRTDNVIDLSTLSDDDDVEIVAANIATRRGPEYLRSRRASSESMFAPSRTRVPTPGPAASAASRPANTRSSGAGGGGGTSNPAAPPRFPHISEQTTALDNLMAQRAAQFAGVLEAERNSNVASHVRRFRSMDTGGVDAPEATRLPSSTGPIRFGGALMSTGNQRLHYEPVRPELVRLAGSGLALDPRLALDSDFISRLSQYGFTIEQPSGRQGVMNTPIMRPLPGPGGSYMGIVPSAAALKEIKTFTFPKPSKRFTRDFEEPESVTTTLDEDGRPVPSSGGFERYLSCARCEECLRQGPGIRDPSDRIWALKCGHLIDQRCLEQLSIPKTATQRAAILPPIDAIRLDRVNLLRKYKPRRRAAPKPKHPETFIWLCPVKDCGQDHVSAKHPGKEDWVPQEGFGPTQVYT